MEPVGIMRSTNPPLRVSPIEKNASWMAVALGGTSFKFGGALGFFLRMWRKRPVGLPSYAPWKTLPPTSQPQETNTCLICSAKGQPSRSPSMHAIFTGILGILSKAAVSIFRCSSESSRGSILCRSSNKSRSAFAALSCCFDASPWSVASWLESVRLAFLSCSTPCFASCIRAFESCCIASCNLFPESHVSQVNTAITSAVKINPRYMQRKFCHSV